MKCPVDKSCCYSYDDLYRAATGRGMSDAEKSGFARLDQPAKNEVVKRLVIETRGSFICEDRLGTDGVTYTAFWAADAE